MVFFDSNMTVYALATDDATKQEQATDLLARHLADRSLVVSTQVMQETFNVLTRKKRLPVDRALAYVGTLTRARVVASDAAFVLKALQLSVDHRLSVWDSLIVQAALEANCTALYTEDLQAGRRFGDLEVINPFDPSVHEPAQAYKSAPRTLEAARRGRRGPASRR
jgi:predicted nucleic acid-binding protein